MERKVVAKSFYTRHDVLQISQELLGKYLCTQFHGQLTSGIIVETEAYRGPEDKASHAYNGRRTKRNEVMYSEGGTSYVYHCYGLHFLFNVVTNQESIPHAILIRALEPADGKEIMAKRRNMPYTKRELTSGPGKLTQALGITKRHNGLDLQHPPVWIEDRGNPLPEIVSKTRIGIDYAEEDAQLPWRFYIKDSPWISKK